MKNLTGEQIHGKFNKLPTAKRIHLLWDALDYMEQYNGRSKTDCLALAMGYSNQSTVDGTYEKEST